MVASSSCGIGPLCGDARRTAAGARGGQASGRLKARVRIRALSSAQGDDQRHGQQLRAALGKQPRQSMQGLQTRRIRPLCSLANIGSEGAAK